MTTYAPQSKAKRWPPSSPPRSPRDPPGESEEASEAQAGESSCASAEDEACADQGPQASSRPPLRRGLEAGRKRSLRFDGEWPLERAGFPMTRPEDAFHALCELLASIVIAVVLGVGIAIVEAVRS